MTLYQFKALDETEQYNIMCDKGIFLTHIINAGYKFALCQIDAFYIEVKYDGDRNRISGIRTFLSITQLEPYLRSIELSSFD